MKTHELKTDHAVFILVAAGLKRFEIRFNDRDFKSNDILHLRETKYSGEEMKKGKPLEYTGREVYAQVVHTMFGPIYGLSDGWVIMSISEPIGN